MLNIWVGFVDGDMIFLVEKVSVFSDFDPVNFSFHINKTENQLVLFTVISLIDLSWI